LIKVGRRSEEIESFNPFSLETLEPRPISAVSFANPVVEGKEQNKTEAAEIEAQRIIEQATIRASEIERHADQNAQTLIQAQVAAEVTRSVDPWREQLKETVEQVAGLREIIVTQAERELVRLAIEIAKKVVHREVTLDNEIVMTLARIGLSRLQDRIAATVHLHPDDYAYVSQHRERIEAGHALELVEDRSIGRGGCLVHTEMGDVDTRIEQQFAEIERAFLEL
jgi:flagellar assembly protein FliH